jgi:cysteine desulfurase
MLRALGRSDELAHSSLRMTLAAGPLKKKLTTQWARSGVAKLRELSPLWGDVQDGVDLSTIQWAAH